MLIGYARTSTTDQKAGLEIQLEELGKVGCEKVFREQVSSVAERSQLEAALEFCREGDTLVITKLDRLARSNQHLWEVVRFLDRKGVGLRILSLGGEVIDTKGATGRLLLNVFASFAQFEREMMRERQKDGIEKAKARGVYKGRKPTAALKAEEVRKLRAEGKTPTEIARALGIGRGSVYRLTAS